MLISRYRYLSMIHSLSKEYDKVAARIYSLLMMTASHAFFVHRFKTCNLFHVKMDTKTEHSLTSVLVTDLDNEWQRQPHTDEEAAVCLVNSDCGPFH